MGWPRLGQVTDSLLAGARHLAVLLHAAADVGGDRAEVDAEDGLAGGFVGGEHDHAVGTAALVGHGQLVPATIGLLAGAELPGGVVHPVGTGHVVEADLDLHVGAAPEGAFAVRVDVGPTLHEVASIVRRVDALGVARGGRRARHPQEHQHCGRDGRHARCDASHLTCLSTRVCVDMTCLLYRN